MGLPRKTRCGACGQKIPLRLDGWQFEPLGAFQSVECKRCGSPVLAMIGPLRIVEALAASGAAEGAHVDVVEIDLTSPTDHPFDENHNGLSRTDH